MGCNDGNFKGRESWRWVGDMWNTDNSLKVSLLQDDWE